MSDPTIRILVADDEPTARLLMEAALVKAGFAVSLAADGEDALRQFRARPYDIVLLDVEMPGLDGYQVCHALRAEAGAAVPIVMVTGMDDVDSIARSYAAGATDFMAKPINWNLIGHRVTHLWRACLTSRELQMANARNAAIIDAIPDTMFRLRSDGMVLDVLTAEPGHAGPLAGRPLAFSLPADVVKLYLDAACRVRASGQAESVEYQLSLADDTALHYELRLTLIDDEETLCLVRDITRRKQADEQLQLAANVFSHSGEAIMITAADGTIVDVNQAFSRITGYSRDEVLGRNPRLLSSGRQGKEFYRAMWHGLLEVGYWCGEVWNLSKSGKIFVAMQTISAVRDAQGQTSQYVALFSDISAIKEHEKQLEHIAHFDALTGLPNRLLLADRLHQGMAQALRRGQRLAVAFLDLDGFKSINDRHGHEAGDQLLIAVATRMKQTLREGDTLARLGGDEFVVVLPDLADIESSVPMLTRLLAATAQPVDFAGLVLQVSASLGVTFYPQPEEFDADQLLRQADQAMYQAKLAGKNRFHVFDAEQDRSVRGHHEGLERIRQALQAQEFVLHYQPKVNMRSGQVIGAEALLRWQHPQRGLLHPAAFMPVLEDHPLMVEVGAWVIDMALTQMERWQALGLNVPVSVNVSARQLQQSDFALRLGQLLAAHPIIKAGDLELEVLETSALEDIAQVVKVIEDCRQIGVLFAMDDFGVGYSSLTYLKRLAVFQLKIDQSFVRDMLDDPDDLAILEGVIGLANAFRRQVIAEGVETVAHGAVLLQLGCELAQGYGIARPMPGVDFPHWVASWRPDPSWSGVPKVSRDELPLLFAHVEYRAWMVAIEDFLSGKNEAPPPLARDQSHLGMWLDTEGLAHQGAQPAVQDLERVHRQVHAQAAELCAMKTQGRHPEALMLLETLRLQRDALLEQLNLLVQERRLSDQTPQAMPIAGRPQFGAGLSGSGAVVAPTLATACAALPPEGALPCLGRPGAAA